MKIFLSVFLLILSTFSFADKLNTSETITLDIPSMFCMTCPITVRLSLDKVEGVFEAVTDLDSKTATITYDSAVTDVESLIDATTNAGYPSTLVLVLADDLLEQTE